ncbi:radical SAM protein [Streptomyces sp. NPDC048349]|uniref:radical SAM protein n=1 Tax=Streptomyces sp. NPDC048349 TaxID=3155486 RepID=UPI0034226598
MPEKIPQILPPHPLRPDYDRSLAPGDIRDDFQKRLEPQNFNVAYLSRLAARMSEALKHSPDDPSLRYQLAFVTMQNAPTTSGLALADELLAGIRRRSGTDAAAVARLRQLLDGMLSRASSARPSDYTVQRVNWSINNRCPMACRGCYNPFVDDQITLGQATMIVDKLARHGTTDLVIAGGDPLLWEPIFDTVDYAIGTGLQVALDTTGYTLTHEKLERLTRLSTLRLPMDGSTHEVQRAFRRSADRDLTSRFKKSLQMCDDVGFRRVRVHTVASRQNVNDLEAIAEIIFGYESVQQWVVFQWWGRRASRALSDEMTVAAEEIESRMARIRAAHPDKEVIFAEATDREFLNFMIQSNGQVVTFAAGLAEEFIVGNLLHDEMGEIIAHPILDFAAMRRGVPVALQEAGAS